MERVQHVRQLAVETHMAGVALGYKDSVLEVCSEV